jgi:hypothetical protein
MIRACRSAAASEPEQLYPDSPRFAVATPTANPFALRPPPRAPDRQIWRVNAKLLRVGAIGPISFGQKLRTLLEGLANER